jgi:serine/threonine protein kinase
MKGPTLRQRMKEIRENTRLVIKVLEQIADALAFIHRSNYSHLDIKPENILFIDSAGETIKLCDFGLATSIDSASDSNLLSVILGAGTEGYIAPELARAAAAVELSGCSEEPMIRQRADQFSFGVTAVEMCTGLTSRTINTAATQLSAVSLESILSRPEMQRFGTDFVKMIGLCLSVEATERPTAVEVYQIVKKTNESFVETL